MRCRACLKWSADRALARPIFWTATLTLSLQRLHFRRNARRRQGVPEARRPRGALLRTGAGVTVPQDERFSQQCLALLFGLSAPACEAGPVPRILFFSPTRGT